jgi:hypothetical protein
MTWLWDALRLGVLNVAWRLPAWWRRVREIRMRDLSEQWRWERRGYGDER